MPRIYIDLDDFYNELSDREIKTIINWLESDGYIMSFGSNTNSNNNNRDFDEVCDKLASSYYRMDNEEIETIINIMKKYN